MDTAQLEPLLVTIDEALRLIGVGRTKLYELINEERLDVVKIGRRTMVRFESLKRLAEHGC